MSTIGARTLDGPLAAAQITRADSADLPRSQSTPKGANISERQFRETLGPSCHSQPSSVRLWAYVECFMAIARGERVIAWQVPNQTELFATSAIVAGRL
jgi:hypothetical protein